MFCVKASPSACDALTQNMNDIDCPTPFFLVCLSPSLLLSLYPPFPKFCSSLLASPNCPKSVSPKLATFVVFKIGLFRLSKVAQIFLSSWRSGEEGQSWFGQSRSQPLSNTCDKETQRKRSVDTTLSCVSTFFTRVPRTKHQPKPPLCSTRLASSSRSEAVEVRQLTGGLQVVVTRGPRRRIVLQ